jgi:hypothetical protein
MTIEFGFTDELTNTQYAPLAALSICGTIPPIYGIGFWRKMDS